MIFREGGGSCSGLVVRPRNRWSNKEARRKAECRGQQAHTLHSYKQQLPQARTHLHYRVYNRSQQSTGTNDVAATVIRNCRRQGLQPPPGPPGSLTTATVSKTRDEAVVKCIHKPIAMKNLGTCHGKKGVDCSLLWEAGEREFPGATGETTKKKKV